MNQEIPSGPLEITPEYRIRGCNTLDELYLVLRDLKEIPGKHRMYDAEELVRRIGDAVTLHMSGAPGGVEAQLELVTRAYGLRDKARELVNDLTVGR